MKAKTSRSVKLMLSMTFMCMALGAEAATTSNCSSKWLKDKDCRLADKTFHMQVWQDKVLANDVRNRDTVTLPYAGDQVEWRQVRLISLGSRHFIEINLWATPDKQTGIQSRNWLLYQWRKGRLQKDLDVSLQKRKQLDDGKFLYDPMTSHKLKFEKSKLIWHCGRQHGIF